MPYQMKNGKWRAHRMIGGKRKTKTFQTKKEAKAWEANQNEETWEEETTHTASLAEWSVEYLNMAKNRFTDATYDEKRTCFRLLFKQVNPDLACEELTVNQVASHLGEQALTRSGNAANKDRKNLAAAWNWGRRYMGLPNDNPFQAVEKFPAIQSPRYVPPEEDMDKILENETGEVRTFLITMLHTAARRGELLRLKWSDVDFERGKIRLWTRKRKGGSLESDMIPMTDILRDELLTHKKNARSVFVFCDPNGQPFSERRWLMHRVCKRNKVHYFSFHAIRHLSASMMDRAGVPLTTIQAILRHKSATTTDRYLHALRGAKANLNGVFGGEKKGKILEIKKASDGQSEAL